MSGSFCPRCNEPVRLPAVDAASEVRCPWCRETYTLEEAMRGLPPILEVVEIVGVSSELDTYEFAPLELPKSSVARNFELPAMSLKPGDDRHPVRRRRGGSPLWGVIKVALGGVAGCLIALLILQYMQRLPDLGFWPFRGPGTGLWGDLERPFLERGRRGNRRPDWQANETQADPNKDLRLGAPEELQLPAFPNDADLSPAVVDQNEPTVDAPVSLLDQLDKVLTTYEQERRGADVLGTDFSDQRAETAKVLIELLAQLASRDGDSLPGARKDQSNDALESLAYRLGDDVKLLREMLPAAWSVLAEDLSADEKHGAVVIGMLGKTSDGWQLMRSASDEMPLPIIVEQAEKLASGRVVLALGLLSKRDEQDILDSAQVYNLKR